MPLISVIIPTYNSAKYLEETLRSIAAQSMQIDQLVLSDDASNDSTKNIIDEFSRHAPFDVLFVANTKPGPTNNYLNAAAHTTGQIIIVSDHDDVWTPDKVEKTVSAFDDPRIELVCHDSELVDAELNSYATTLRGGLRKSERFSRQINEASDRDQFLYFLKGKLPWLAHTLSFRHSLLRLLLEKPDHIPDWWFEEWLGCIALTQGRMHSLPEALVKYRQHATQTSGGIYKAPSIAPPKAAEKYLPRIRRLEYCSTLVAAHDETRSTLFAAYLKFLRQRQRSVNGQLSLSITQLVRGHYHRFAHGFKSFMVDALLIFKNLK